MRARIDAESPLRVALIARALRDPQIQLVPRAIDSTWVYRQVVRRSNTGFNPFCGRVYYASRGALAPWLAHPERSARDYNAQDSMMRELLFVVHDYLHAWSYGVIRELAPFLDFGRARITTSNFEHLVFAHLLTEAVATVGLDYWCLATARLGDTCPMGTAIEGATTSYREWHRPEYLRVWPDLVVVQEPSFLHWLLSSYLNGGARMSISEREMDRSALLARWLRGELSYAEHQRRYIRLWLHHLSGSRSRRANTGRVVAYDELWQRNLVIEVALRLWSLVKHDKSDRLRDLLDPESCWQTRKGSKVDFDLTNLNELSPTELRSAAGQADASQRRALCEQYVMRFRYSDVEEDEVPRIQRAIETGNLSALRSLLRGCAPLPPSDGEPRDLMLFA